MICISGRVRETDLTAASPYPRSLKPVKKCQNYVFEVVYHERLESLDVNTLFHHLYKVLQRYMVAQLVEALCCTLEDHRFDSRWCHWNFSLT